MATLGLRRFTGQLRMHPEHPQHVIAFDRGFIVGATSPLAIDSIARVALTSEIITAAQVAELQRRITATPKRDEVDLLVEVTKLAPERAVALRQHVVTQRAARTFSLDGGYVIDERITIPRHATCEVDVRAVVYMGAVTNLAHERLATELRALGSRFSLRPKALRELASYDFPDSALPVLESLRTATTIPELLALHRDVDPHEIQAIVYALLACETCMAEDPERRTGRGTGESAPARMDAENRGARGTTESGPVRTLERTALPQLARITIPPFPRATTPPPPPDEDDFPTVRAVKKKPG